MKVMIFKDLVFDGCKSHEKTYLNANVRFSPYKKEPGGSFLRAIRQLTLMAAGAVQTTQHQQSNTKCRWFWHSS